MSPRLHASYAGCYGYTSGMVGHLSLVCGSWRTQVQEHFGPGRHQLPGFYTTAEHQLPGNLRTTSSLVQHQSLVALACPGYTNTSTPVWVARDVHVHHFPFIWQVVGGHACGWHRETRGTQWGLSESPLFNGIADELLVVFLGQDFRGLGEQRFQQEVDGAIMLLH